MNKKYIVTFSCFFILAYFVVHSIFNWQHNQLIEYYHHETDILHHNVADRFTLLMDTHQAIGLVASEYISSGNLGTSEYEDLTRRILENFDEILGLNILNNEGTIINVSPKNANQSALGKTTQNIDSLTTSYKNNEPYWLSPPFKLFQGGMGFSFYMPIVKKGKQLGWVAPVIDQSKFFKKFVTSEFLTTYHLIIRDEVSGRTYFATENSPMGVIEKFENEKLIKDRKISFISWPKKPNPMEKRQLYLSLILALGLSVLGIFSLWMYDQKLIIRKRLESLSNLLRMTVNDTGQSLTTIQRQFEQMQLSLPSTQLQKVSRHLNYMNTLLRQMEMLQKLTGNIKRQEFTRETVLPMILEVTDLLNDEMNEKRVILIYDPQELSHIEILADKWLICHSVLRHFIRQAMLMSPANGDIELKYSKENQFNCFSILHKGVGFHDELLHGKITDEETFVAEKVIQLHQGKLHFQNTSDGGMVIIKLPILR